MFPTSSLEVNQPDPTFSRSLLYFENIIRQQRLLVADYSPNDETQTDDDSNNGNSSTDQTGHEKVSERKDKVLIQGIKESVMKHFKENQYQGYVNETKLLIKSSSKVKPASLINNLVSLKSLCKSEELKSSIGGLIFDIMNMYMDGGARMFTTHNHGSGTNLEFICVAVYKYEINGQEACDFLLSRYSQVRQSRIGILSFFQRQCSPDELKDMVEASFIKELVERNFAKLENSQLYMITED
ncbi:unnamed protein product [Auanema sp. JU1783]|nr:unnamed protein product [Auanema sp. JU1783]